MPMHAVRAEGLSKRYQIGAREQAARSFREAIAGALTAPFRRARRLAGRDETWFWALRDVDFALEAGELVAVIGRNGAGKSTLLKILSRVTEPTAGRIALRGRMASLLEVGTGFHPDLTGRENIFLNGAILGMPRAEIRRKFDAIVEFAEVSRFLDTPIKHYSSGMYLRLAFSVAAHLDGEILVVDEVLAVGDLAFQQKCLGKMQDVGRGGRTVLFVTHNMMAASTLCRRGVLLEAGRVKVDAPIQEAIKAYLSDASATGRTWDVSNAPRDHDRGDAARIVRIEALSRHADGFRFNDPLVFRVTLVGRSRVGSLGVGAGIDDVFGHRLATFESQEIGFALDVDRGATRSVELVVPRPCLNPGRYFLSVSLVSGEQYFDLLMHAAQFDVAPLDAQTGAYFEPIAGSGALRLPYEWRESALEAPHAERWRALS